MRIYKRTKRRTVLVFKCFKTTGESIVTLTKVITIITTYCRSVSRRVPCIEQRDIQFSQLVRRSGGICILERRESSGKLCEDYMKTV